LTNLIPLPNGPYGSSKAALNFVTKRIAQEEEKNGLIAFPLTPGKRPLPAVCSLVPKASDAEQREQLGWVATDLGNHGAKAFGLDVAPLSLEDSVKGIVSVIRSADMSTSGKFMGYDGKETAW
jgi:norsolorinic acid ketoreductase